ncbi:MAG TPA: tetratricopeptide repeat protein [Burkholderiaceae bacterium]|nr:tetratricopeptide repeat protein [Burkholderiaceae bacterium]
MPVARLRSCLLLAAAGLAFAPWQWSHAQAAADPAESVVRSPVPSAMDAVLFYQVLIGEMELRQGQAGVAYEVILDAAQKTRDEALFRRAVEIALQARAGDQALAAAQAWRMAVPVSAEAHRLTAQVLVGLNRPAEALDPLRGFLAATPATERPAAIALLPRLFGRSGDRKTLAGVVEQVLQPYAQQPATRGAVLVANARMRWLAQEPQRALELAQEASQLDPAAEGPALIGLEMLSSEPRAEALVQTYLDRKPDAAAVRLAYVRTLVGAQRYADAVAQLERATQVDPTAGPMWLSLGALRLELKQPREAERALLRYVELAAAPAAQPAASGPASADAGDGLVANPAEGLTQAYLLLAQAAEEQRDFRRAEEWLARIENADNALSVQLRRAMLQAKQGRVNEARELLRRTPERTPQDARAKSMAESQLLRELKMWSDAHAVLAEANQRFPDDADLLYEQAMMSEKLHRLDEMERLLRRVIEIKPDHFHAYNALGYTLADRNIRLEEARTLVLKALELAPNEPFIIDSLGWVEYRMGRREEALKHLQRAFEARPDAEIAAHLGEVLWMLGRKDEARRVWREGRERDATNEVLRETLTRLKVDL